METAYSINSKNSILVSRNRPLALVVGVAGYLGSNVGDKLLKKGIQVIGIDDFSSGDKINLVHAVKEKDFHLINESINSQSILQSSVLNNLPRLDYAFFLADSENPERIYSTGLLNFLHLIKNLKEKIDDGYKTKITFVSSIDLYDSKLSHKNELLKEAEVKFAKFTKYYKLNGRIVRLAKSYGPRMHFREEDPVMRLIQASLSNSLQSEQINLDFSSRSLFVEDVVNLIIKATLSGSTAQKIFDGALYQPIKVSEIKQILMDPLWHQDRDFQPTELPPWPTPNLLKTQRELHWKPKVGVVEGLRRTIAYFKDNNVEIPELTKLKQGENLSDKWSFKKFDEGNLEISGEKANKEFKLSGKDGKAKRGSGFKRKFNFLVIFLIIFLGLIWPFLQIVYGVFNIRNNLQISKAALEEGNFEKASQQVIQAKMSLDETEKVLSYLEVLKKLGVFKDFIEKVNSLVLLAGEGIDGTGHAIKGSQILFQTSRVISGEDRSDPKPLYQKAQSELTTASQIISKVLGRLSDHNLLSGMPEFVRDKNNELVTKLVLYQNLVDKARVASYLMPQITAVDGKKKYLILLENNLELRPTGGFIGSYGRLDFENGRLVNILVDDIYNLDGGLKDVIEPPAELKRDLGISRWYLRDSNFDPDFPTSARQAEFFFKKESQDQVNGVIAMDLSASGKLLDAIKGLDLPEYGEHVDGGNLFERAISHAEVGFFPGSQAKKNYLVSLQSQLFNKVFFLSKQNWPAIINALGESLDQKHIMVYLPDPYLFSYLTSANWAGLVPRAGQSKDGETNDFLAVIESNMGANKANYYLERKYKLETSVSKEGVIFHKLRVNYKNNSPSEVFPAGIYKNRLRLYLPLGAKVSKVLFGETELTSKVTSFSDYGRSGYSMFLPLAPKETKQLIVEYNLNLPISFVNGGNTYRLEIFKQAGVDRDPFEWQLSVPINLKAQLSDGTTDNFSQEVSISTDLQKDRSFLVNLKKR